MISSSDRKKVIELISEARQNGARLKPACDVVGISERTYQRWTKEGSQTADKRPLVERKPPMNKLSDDEKAQILAVCNSVENADLTPSQIVPQLADKGQYIASESTFYRVLREFKQNAKRTPINSPVKRPISTHIADGPNQVWSWDITWLPAEIKGHYFKLYPANNPAFG